MQSGSYTLILCLRRDCLGTADVAAVGLAFAVVGLDRLSLHSQAQDTAGENGRRVSNVIDFG